MEEAKEPGKYGRGKCLYARAQKSRSRILTGGAQVPAITQQAEGNREEAFEDALEGDVKLDTWSDTVRLVATAAEGGDGAPS